MDEAARSAAVARLAAVELEKRALNIEKGRLLKMIVVPPDPVNAILVNESKMESHEGSLCIVLLLCLFPVVLLILLFIWHKVEFREIEFFSPAAFTIEIAIFGLALALGVSTCFFYDAYKQCPFSRGL
jgi:membrane-associated HD superfamily phosphohydrolase